MAIIPGATALTVIWNGAASLASVRTRPINPTLEAAETGRVYGLRLFESTGNKRTTVLTVPPLGLHQAVSFSEFELKSLLLDPERGTLQEIDLLERGKWPQSDPV